MLDIYLVGFAIVAQLLASGFALRLNFRCGGHWAWLLICCGFLLMAVRRSLTFYNLSWGELATPALPSGVASETAAGVTFLSSLFLLAGVMMFEPLFRALTESQRLLQRDRSQLADSLATAENDLSAAEIIQRRLFPPAQLRHRGVVICGHSQPVRFAGGDYFDFFPMSNGDVLAIVADVTGHGMGAALLMAELRACLRTASRQSLEPAALMEAANQLLADSTDNGQFATCFLAVIHHETSTLSFVGADHECWLVRGDGKVESLQGDSLPLGIDPNATFPVKSVGYGKDDVLLLVTDGVFESSNVDGQSYGIARTLKVVTTFRSSGPQQIIDHLLADVSKFRGAAELMDDVTVVVLDLNPT